MTAGINRFDGPTVSAGYAKALLDFAVAQGAGRSVLLASSGIAADALSDRDNRVPFASYVALMRSAKVLCDAPDLGLRFGAGTNFEEVSLVGLICRAAGTMGEALQQLNRYRGLIAEVDLGGGERFELVSRDGGLWLEDRRPDPNAFPELTEETFARFVCEVARSYGDVPFVTAVEVTHARPDHAAAYEAVLKAPVVYGAARNALRIEPSWLSLQTRGANSYVFGIFNDRADALLARLEAARTVRGEVERLLMPRLHLGAAGMAVTAGLMNLSRPTLYRRLKAEGVSFDQVLDELRRELAKTYLARLSVNETAYLLGFSDRSAFSRAFKRWTGQGPRGWKGT
ncbi:AraC family transcriptional regulator [Phenylobacterium glaciei]|uniref:AraC family transcriptional regulator n=1 Tax=Phenylobacterium glaciei TaxID=2803784 RepID=UPI00322215A1